MRENKEPRRAVYLSILLTGLGQVYNRQIKLGVVLICFSLVGILISLAGIYLLVKFYFLSQFPTFVYVRWGIVLLIVGWIIILGLGIYSAVNAYKVSSKRKGGAI